MATSLYTHHDANIRRTWFLMSFFFILLIIVGFGLSYFFEAPEILIVAVIYSVVTSVTSYWFSDRIVLRMTHAVPADRAQYFDLYTVTENLAITAGLPMPKLYVITDPAPNAFATGRNKHHAVVAVTTGLLQKLERNELEGVIAHELSHIGNNDMLIATMTVVMVGTLALVADIATRMILGGAGSRNNDREGQGGGGGGIMIIVGLVIVILMPIIGTMLRLSISRKREFLADASGALLTRYPEGLARALEKISSADMPMQKTNNATAHLFIADPHGLTGAKKFFNKIFATHPPVEERVRALRESA